ncbi:MAG TPA: DUF4390 domain-containing protein [Nitrospirae bacterium]|nr:DUF4390 domain-containing protein [Nitrospirota bacterium]
MWKFWPDEFVVSKRIERVIKHDRLRGQYRTVSTYGNVQSERKFRDFDTMKSWTFTFNDINVANIRELEPGSYYVRVVAESRSRELPPIIGMLMFFIPEVEMSLAKESYPFTVGDGE